MYASEHVLGIVEDLFSEADVSFFKHIRSSRVKSKDEIYDCFISIDRDIFMYIASSFTISYPHGVFTQTELYEFEELKDNELMSMVDGPVEMVAMINAATNDLPFPYRKYAKHLLEGFDTMSFSEQENLPYSTVHCWLRGLKQHYMDNGYIPRNANITPRNTRWTERPRD